MKPDKRFFVKAKPSVLFCRIIWYRMIIASKFIAAAGSRRYAGGFLGRRVKENRKLNAVLLSYRRMGNLRHIVQSLLTCSFIDKIVLSNNNPEIQMENCIRIREPRFSIINQTKRCFPGIRYDLAYQLPGEYFISIDDDTFLTPCQIRKLFAALLENPAVPHGGGGEDLTIRDGKILSARQFCGQEREVDIILWAYAFTREHIVRYFELLERLKIGDGELLANEDVIISFSGAGKARCENLGKILYCPTAKDKNIATHRQDGFFEQRYNLYLQCRNIAVLK